MKNMTSILRIMPLLMLIIVSCAKKDDLAEKKAKLVELQKLIVSTNDQIKLIQKDLEKLEPAKVEKIKTVAVMPIMASNFQHFVEAMGRIESENNVLVSPQTGGAITHMYVKLGDYVSKGQRIASIDNSILTNSIQEVQTQLETAKTIYDRQKNLWDQKIGTEIQLIQARTNVESLQRRIATLHSQGKLNLVVAPISGQIDEVRFKEGEMSAPGLGIVRIVNFSSLKVVANIPDTYAGTISKGDLVNIKFPDLQKSITAHLNFVSQTINPANRTFTVEAKIPTVDKDLKPNLSAIVNVNDQSNGAAIVIPENYVQTTEQGLIVYIAENQGNKIVARAKKVTTGLSYNGKIEIKSGLNSGDMVISEGYQEIVEGQLINY